MNNPLISVIITVYNFEKFIREALESVLVQEGDFSFEIIVIDDCSTDSSAKIIGEFQDLRIHFIRHEENKGANFSVNEGFSLAKGRFIARLDGDDRYYPDFFKKTFEELEKHPEAGFVFGDFTTINQFGEITTRHAKPARPAGPEVRNEFRHILQNYYITAPTLMGRREAWEKGLPVPQEFSFLDWFLSLSKSLFFPAVYIPEPLAFYRIHASSMHHTMVSDRRGEMITRLILDRFIPLGLEKNLISFADANLIKYSNFTALGDKYFGAGMYDDARRCYSDALKVKPFSILSPEFVKHYSGSVFPKLYNQIKSAGRT